MERTLCLTPIMEKYTWLVGLEKMSIFNLIIVWRIYKFYWNICKFLKMLYLGLFNHVEHHDLSLGYLMTLKSSATHQSTKPLPTTLFVYFLPNPILSVVIWAIHPTKKTPCKPSSTFFNKIPPTVFLASTSTQSTAPFYQFLFPIDMLNHLSNSWEYSSPLIPC